MTTLLLFKLAVSLQLLHPADRTDTLRALAGNYNENHAKFNSGTLTFEYQDGRADTLEDAIAGRFEKVYKTDGFYTLDKNDAMYSRLFSAEALAASTTKGDGDTMIGILDSRRALTNGRVTLVDDYVWGSKGRIVSGNIILAGT